jgi:hypothetical protein
MHLAPRRSVPAWRSSSRTVRFGLTRTRASRPGARRRPRSSPSSGAVAGVRARVCAPHVRSMDGAHACCSHDQVRSHFHTGAISISRPPCFTVEASASVGMVLSKASKWSFIGVRLRRIVALGHGQLSRGGVRWTGFRPMGPLGPRTWSSRFQRCATALDIRALHRYPCPEPETRPAPRRTGRRGGPRLPGPDPMATPTPPSAPRAAITTASRPARPANEGSSCGRDLLGLTR